MPVNVKIIHTKDFVRSTATGVLDFAASKQTLLDIASQIKEPGEYEVLVDTREAESTLSINDVYELGKALADHPSLRRSNLCLLVPVSAMEQAQFFETVAVNRGAQTKAFASFEQAITWLVMREAS